MCINSIRPNIFATAKIVDAGQHPFCKAFHHAVVMLHDVAEVFDLPNDDRNVIADTLISQVSIGAEM